MRPFVCVFAFATLSIAAPFEDFKPDVATPAPAEMASFLRAICPGHGSATGCDACPPGTSFPQDRWTLESVLFGHFRSAASDDAILTGSGCEPAVSGQGGSYLFTRQESKWRKIRYTPGYPLTLCKKLLASDGRDLLVCENSDMHQGVADTFLYLLDPGKAPQADSEGATMIFLGFDDSLGSCVKLPDGTLVSGAIGSVGFTKQQREGGVLIDVELLLGKATIPDRVLRQQCDGKGHTPVITTMPRTYRFLFDGEKVTPLESNPKTQRGWAIPPQTSYRAH